MSEPTDADPNRETEIPEAVGTRLQAALGLEDRPRTLTEWGTAMGEVVGRDGIDAGLDALCTTDQSPHRAEFDGTTEHFLCVQDAFIVPYVVGDVETVEVTTVSPVSGQRIEVTVTGGEVETDPQDAVMSVGVAADVSAPAADPERPEIAYGKVCPYGHAFPTRSEYERWAETVDAVTMEAPLEDAVRLARAIGDAT